LTFRAQDFSSPLSFSAFANLFFIRYSAASAALPLLSVSLNYIQKSIISRRHRFLLFPLRLALDILKLHLEIDNHPPVAALCFSSLSDLPKMF
jgi:hypothetical protein